MDPTSPEAQAELAQRHKAAATTVIGLLIGTILLSVAAFLGKAHFQQQDNPPLDIAVRIAILILGLGSIAYRRTKFSPMRLQDIYGLQGASGLLKTLQKTTTQIGFLAFAITVVGFIGTVLTGNDFYTYLATAVSIIVLIYCYPTRSSWVRTLHRYASQKNEAE